MVIYLAGTWILVPAYVDDSYQHRKWQNEEVYEIGSKYVQSISSEEDSLLLSAPQRWRLFRQTSGGKGPFSGWVVLMLLRDRHKSDVYSRYM